MRHRLDQRQVQLHKHSLRQGKVSTASRQPRADRVDHKGDHGSVNDGYPLTAQADSFLLSLIMQSFLKSFTNFLASPSESKLSGHVDHQV